MVKIKSLSIDLESFSSTDLTKCGVYKYAEADDFEILLFAYSVDGGEVKVIDLANGEEIPQEIIDALTDDTVIKWAFNANFERVCLSRYLRDKGISLDPFADNHDSVIYLGIAEFLNPQSWRCSMVWSAYMGMPQSLKDVGTILGLEKQKLTEGKELIRYFCTPCKPTKTNGERVRNLPIHAPDKWELFKAYNKRDVEVEIAIKDKLGNFPVPDFVWEEYAQDQEINDRGVKIDMELVQSAIAMDARSKNEITNQIKALTSVENPNSVIQMKNWLNNNGLEVESLGKKEIEEHIKSAPEELRKVLELRGQIAKSSIKKYQAMQNAVCSDGRTRGMFRFYGANRTGRWSGQLIQMQNLKRNSLPDLDAARELVKDGNYEAVEMLYGSVPDVLSELVRTAFVPKANTKLVVADFSAIEARVIAWLAGEKWRNDVFATHGKIYEASAAQMFKVPIEEITKGSPLRQKGKIAELALGYGGSVGALKAMGALEMGLTEDELQPLVNAWRSANPNIVKLWWDVDRAAKEAVAKHTVTETHGIKFSYRSGMLFITLPSGRTLSYVKPRIGENKFGGESVTYEGVGAAKKWERIESYGPKFVENIVQAISRDLLAYAMQAQRCCSIVMHIHDEIVIEADKRMSTQVLCEQMGRTPDWAKGLLLKAEGYECGFYKKD